MNCCGKGLRYKMYLFVDGMQGASRTRIEYIFMGARCRRLGGAQLVEHQVNCHDMATRVLVLFGPFRERRRPVLVLWWQARASWFKGGKMVGVLSLRGVPTQVRLDCRGVVTVTIYVPTTCGRQLKPEAQY